MDEQQHIKRCIKLVEKNLQWGPSSSWTTYNFNKLSSYINEKSNISLSGRTLRRLTKDDSKRYEIVFESMFAKRHEVWMPNMIQLMNDHTCFFAVGVGHLSGNEGLIDLLRQKGYNVKHIDN